MLLLVIRHAIAEDRDTHAEAGVSDDDRPLTSFGKRRMRRNAQGLRRAASHVEVVAASPLVRAQQTARLVADEYAVRDIETVEALRPGQHPRELLRWLSAQPPDATVAVVGHEPQVGRLVTWCVTGVDTATVNFKKGGAALIAFDRKPAAGKGELQWLLTPAQLRAMAE